MKTSVIDPSKHRASVAAFASTVVCVLWCACGPAGAVATMDAPESREPAIRAGIDLELVVKRAEGEVVRLSEKARDGGLGHTYPDGAKVALDPRSGLLVLSLREVDLGRPVEVSFFLGVTRTGLFKLSGTILSQSDTVDGLSLRVGDRSVLELEKMAQGVESAVDATLDVKRGEPIEIRLKLSPTSSRVELRVAVAIEHMMHASRLKQMVEQPYVSANPSGPGSSGRLKVVASSTEEFFGQMNTGSWQYGYHDSARPYSRGSFTHYPTFDSSAGHWTIFEGSTFGGTISRTGGQPDDWAWAVRRWTSENSSYTRIYGEISLTLDEMPTEASGVVGKILVNGTEVFSQSFASGGRTSLSYSIGLVLTEGDAVDFALAPVAGLNPAEATFTATIEQIPEPTVLALFAAGMVLLVTRHGKR